jgi:copper chaperone for superoxide dismutase
LCALTFADFLVSAAVAEFKGPVIFGVVRLAQVNMELARVEATFSGLSPGKHGWSINEFGDLTKGAESTGKAYNPPDYLSNKVMFQLLVTEGVEKSYKYSNMGYLDIPRDLYLLFRLP